MRNDLPKLVFATNNAHKLKEARQLAEGIIDILSLSDIGCHDEIPETADTLEGNALIKARWIKDRYGYNCFADDTGLLVDALNGEPGVMSARYAGEHCSPEDNMNLLLERLNGEENRKAKFKTVIALINDEKEFLFQGEVDGYISTDKRGKEGFGYDPVFIEAVSGLTFAQMSDNMKNSVSHRGRAMKKFIDFIKR